MVLPEFHNFLKSDKIYSYDEMPLILKEVRTNFRFAYTNKKIRYFNVPVSFDIETSSFFRSTGKDTEKVSIMYEWTFGIYGLCIIGRTWEQFIYMIKELSSILDLNERKRLIVYVHNLSYEFQFIRKHFEWSKVFSIDSRKPIYALSTDGIEFRCSYMLSGYSLAKLGEQLQTYKVQKLVGALDYDKVRHSETVLTKTEIDYCINDVKVVMAYIAERIENDGDVGKLPLTRTGYVRSYCRNSCFYEEGKRRKESFKRVRYMELMDGMRLSADEYKQLKRAFQGGFTHANPFHSGKVLNNVDSYDFTSSYPFVMVSEKFPMSASDKIQITSKEQFQKNLKLYCCLFDVEFEGLQSKLYFDSYISISRCWEVRNAVTNNGRIVSAEHLKTTITEQDFLIISKFYTWEHIKIGTFRRYKKDYLPTDLVKAILKLYCDKTTLKGVEVKEVEYMNSKEKINAVYGMAVTDIVRDEVVYSNNEWAGKVKADYEKAIAKYNDSRSRFLFYPWGVWVTAYARRNLFTGILEFGNDYVYSDTDSLKGLNSEKHQKYINEYNSLARIQLQKAMDFHGIDYSAFEPETVKGVKKCLGLWDFDGSYDKFKTLGAKRYMVKYSNDERNSKHDRGKVNITVSGLNKQICVPWMLSKWGDDVFEHFSDDLYVPPEYTGKNTHTYIDEIREGDVTDYIGNTSHYKELSAVHLEKADYSLSITAEYAEYIRGIQCDEISG